MERMNIIIVSIVLMFFFNYVVVYPAFGILHVIQLNDLPTCNVVSANGYVLAQPTDCKQTKETLQQEVDQRGMRLLWVEANEFAKVDGALTCKSVLI